MDTEIATDDVTDSIAHIEMYRQIAMKEAGLAASCSQALRKLHELLDHERAVLQRQESGAGHSANIDAVTSEIEKVKKLARTASAEAPASKQLHPGRQQVPRQDHHAGAPRRCPGARSQSSRRCVCRGPARGRARHPRVPARRARPWPRRWRWGRETGPARTDGRCCRARRGPRSRCRGHASRPWPYRRPPHPCAARTG